MPIADNNNIEDKANYVQNGTNCHLLNTQLNYINKVPGEPTMDSFPRVNIIIPSNS
jgi:hypothetical protein